MTRQIDFGVGVEQEVVEARDWYDEQQAGLGELFIDAVEAVIDRIAETPLAFPRVYNVTRRAVLRRFPYSVYFRLHGNSVIILAVIHGSRYPDRWQSRS